MPGRLVFSTTSDGSAGPTERLRITSAGNVGIGTSSPGSTLTVNGTARVQNAGSFAGINVRNNNDSSAVATTSFFDASNNLGTIDGHLFFEHLTTGGCSAVIATTPAGDRAVDRRVTRLTVGFNGTTTLNSAAATAPFIAQINSAEAARIDSSGRLLVGTSTARGNYTSSYAPVLQLETVGTITQRSVGFAHNSNDDTGAILWLASSRGTTSNSNTIVQNNDEIGAVIFSGADGTNLLQGASIIGQVDGTPGTDDMPSRLVFSTTADGASTPTERMRITNVGAADGNLVMYVGGDGYQATDGRHGLAVYRTQNNATANAANSVVKIGLMQLTSRSINAAGTVNASGADYAEYMTKAGDFEIAKGDVCGVTADGKLTNVFADAVGFLVKSTNPSYVGGDTWGNESVVGERHDTEDAELLVEWEAALEAERQKVDRIAFAGQVPVNVTGATPGQYIVPIVTEDGGITGIAKDETDLTLPEYMRAVGKVIAIENDGRARIIVKAS
jgi:hypothetical protein